MKYFVHVKRSDCELVTKHSFTGAPAATVLEPEH